MSIPSYEKWRKGTFTWSIRSGALSDLDDAIKRYELAPSPINASKVKMAFQAWKRSRSDKNMPSARDNYGMVAALEQALQTVGGVAFKPEEMQALQYIAKERKLVLQKLFQNREITYRLGSKAAWKKSTSDLQNSFTVASEKGRQVSAGLGIAAGAGGISNMQHAPGAANMAAQAGRSVMPPAQMLEKIKETLLNKVQQMVLSFTSVDGMVSNLDALGPINNIISFSLTQAIANCTPVVGYATGAFATFTSWMDTVIAANNYVKTKRARHIFEVGDPQAAYDAVKVCIKRDLDACIATAAITTAIFSLQTGMNFVDGGVMSGPILGALAALASALQELVLAIIERVEVVRVKALLRDPSKLDMRIFSAYPLLGCYMLMSATFSDLIPLECFGMAGWVDYIEEMKSKRFDDLYQAAADLIDRSQFEIVGMPKRPVGSAGAGLGNLIGSIFNAGLNSTGAVPAA